MSKPSLPSTPSPSSSKTIEERIHTSHPRRRRSRKTSDSSDVLVSAVISSYLLTHLHHVLQRAEFGAAKDGRKAQAKNFAQLRKVLCMDARSMEDASARGTRNADYEQRITPQIRSDAA